MIKKLNFIRPVVSVIIISVVLILLFCNGLVVNADDTFSLVDKYNIPENSFSWDQIGNNFPCPDITGDPTGVNSRYMNYYNTGLNALISNEQYFDYPLYLCNSNIEDSTSGELNVYSIPEGSFLVYNGGNFDTEYRTYYFVFVPVDVGVSSLFCQRFGVSSRPFDYTSKYNNVEQIIDGVSYVRFRFSDRYIIHRTNLPIYYFNNSDILTIETLEGLDDLNPYSSGSSSVLYPDGSGGAADNNLVLKNPDFKWNVPKYWSNVNSIYPQEVYTSNWGSGTVSFSALLNDYQLDNLDKFDLAIDFYVYFEINGLQSYGSEVSTKKASKFNMDTIYISLSDFYNNGQSVSYNLNTLFDLYLKNANDDSLLSYIEPFKHYYQIDYWDWYINGYVNLVESSDHSSKSGNYIEGYNFISQVSKEYSDNITNNDNPYIPDNEDDIPVKDPEDSQTITNSNGQIVLTNNDNDNITINGNGEVAEDIVNNLIPSDGVGGLSDQLQEHLDSNGWLSVLKSTFPMFGVDFWDMVGTYFLIALGVCVTGFVLRIILDLL